MTYKTHAELPENVKNVLPEHAQEIYPEAFNSAWDQYDESEERQEDRSQKETAHRIAWAAVKRTYRKDEESGRWKEK